MKMSGLEITGQANDVNLHRMIVASSSLTCLKRSSIPLDVHKTVVINAVGLTRELIGPHTPAIQQLARKGAVANIEPVLPAVTCPVQSTYLTGAWPDEHGIVGNGWYFRDEAEIRFWRQSNRLVHGQMVWDAARELDAKFTCANLFWWFNMYSSADYSVTPRPMYPADGRKIPDIYTNPASLRDDLQESLGRFPLFEFWGPATSINSTRWIANAAMHVDRKLDPTLSLIYLPHLDYVLQRVGPADALATAHLRELDVECAKLIEYFQSRGARIIVLSEYGIAPVSRPVHLNRVLRERGFLTVRSELGRDLLDAGASIAFAVADHQVAHVYVNDLSQLSAVQKLLQDTPGVAKAFAGEARREIHLDHPRSGEIIALAEPDAWFTYYYWLSDECAPDFARTVDIHRKPGYDPVELFFDPSLRWPKLKVARKLALRKAGLRTLLDVIPLDASLVRGSHGIAPSSPDRGAMLIISLSIPLANSIAATDVKTLILRHLTDPA
jgi:predicted AlkP superfamily pyrophosphatase or phosphodiesterase